MHGAARACGIRRAARCALALGALALGACNDVIVPEAPQRTGSRGGRLPGMSTTADARTPSAGGEAFIQEQTRVLPDGTVRTVTSLGGLAQSETWRRRNGSVERVVWFGEGAWVRSVEDFDGQGVRVRATVYMPGTAQIERIEEYTPTGDVVSFRTYWPNGQLRLYSADNVETPYGKLYQVQEWWPNGQPRRLEQFEHLPTREYRPRRHGRHAEWDEFGQLRYDAEYNHGRLVRDHVQTPPAEP